MLQYYGEGESYARISLVKFDTIGEPLWIQQLAQEDSLITNEEGNYLYQSKSGNFLISGAAYHPDYLPYWILTDTNGTEIWDLFWNDINGESHQVHEMYNNFFYATSWALNENGVQTPMLFKFNESGNSIASYFLMGDTITAGSSSPIDLNADTTLVIGLTWRVGIPLDEGFSEIIITDTLGNLLNRRILVAEYHVPQRIFISSDNKILVTGYYFVDNNFDIYLWKMNAKLS